MFLVVDQLGVCPIFVLRIWPELGSELDFE